MRATTLASSVSLSLTERALAELGAANATSASEATTAMVTLLLIRQQSARSAACPTPERGTPY